MKQAKEEFQSQMWETKKVKLDISDSTGKGGKFPKGALYTRLLIDYFHDLSLIIPF